MTGREGSFMLRFVLPTENDHDAVLSFYNEVEKSGGECIGFRYRNDYDRWLSDMRNLHAGKDLPQGYVREDFYICYDGADVVGVFSLKFELTDYLLNYGDHVGYAVRPSRRCEGIATRILAEGMNIARRSGFERLLCICDDDNYASEKVIIKNGGVPENTLYDPDEKVTVKRYWIGL